MLYDDLNFLVLKEGGIQGFSSIFQSHTCRREWKKSAKVLILYIYIIL